MNGVKVDVDVLGRLPVPNIPCGLCGRKATLNLNLMISIPLSGSLSLYILPRPVREGVPRAQELCEDRRGRPGLPVPNSLLWSLCRRSKGTLN